jgi:hypothetical protein
MATARSRASAVAFADAQSLQRRAARHCSMSRCCCTTSPRGGRRTIRRPAPASPGRLVPASGLVEGRHRYGRLAGRESSGHVDDGPDARPQRPQDDRGFRRRGAVGRAAEASAGADRLRHPRRRARRVERLEGAAPADALLRDRAAADRRLLGGLAGRSARRKPRGCSTRRGARRTGRREERKRGSPACTTSNYLLVVDLEGPGAARRLHPGGRCGRAGKKLATMVQARTQFEAVTEITVLCAGPSAPAFGDQPAPARRRAATSSTRRFSRRRTAGRWTRSLISPRVRHATRTSGGRARAGGAADRGCVLSGQSWLSGDDREAHQAAAGGQRRSGCEPRAEVRNTLSNRFSVVEVTGLDRPGLLSEITGALSDPVAGHRVRAYHHLRRKGDRHFLRHRPDGAED